MGAPKGNTNGKLFTSNSQPHKRTGRKPTRIKQLINAYANDDQLESISNEDVHKLLAYILCCTKTNIEAMLRHPALPFSIACIIRAMIVDLQNVKTTIVDRVFDWVYGKASQTVELTGAGGNQLIPDRPMSRKDYEKLLNDLKCGK